MKSIHRLFLALTFLVCSNATAYDISETIFLDRYTVLTNGTLRQESGYLLKSGRYQSLLSQIVDPIFISSLYDFVPISGRPVMNGDMFDSYKAYGFIPNWKRSRDIFYIGYTPHVIVATGSQDPNPIPIILEQPRSHRVLLGDYVFLDVDAEPYFYLSYQWKFRNRPLLNATASYLFVQNIGPEQAGSYRVDISAGGKIVKSKKAIIKIVKPVVLAKQPKSQIIAVGGRALFKVSARGTGPFQYQWYFNGAPIPLAIKSYYSIPQVQEANAGSYAVSVDNGPSYEISINAVLTVMP